MEHVSSFQGRREEALVQRARTGDHASFDQLASHYRPLLRALAFVRTGDFQEAEDLAQDVLARAWEKLPTLQQAAAFLPWLKTILANACNSWHRRARAGPVSLDAQAEDRLLAPPGLGPLSRLLAREQQRELRQVLVTLPDANRVALLMHVWGDYSYEEIAAFTGVAVTTVEGRIYRAKRQLRRALHDEGTTLLGRQPRQRAVTPDEATVRRKDMTDPTVGPATKDLPQPLTLVLFTQRFSAMIDAGISLVRSLLALEELPAPYGGAAHDIRLAVEQGHTLSGMMAAKPDLFSPIYVGLVRAGEVGGVLEETLHRAAELMTQEWQLAHRPGAETSVFLILPAERPRPDDWAGLGGYQQTVTLILFLETLGKLLISGVPILRALETVSVLLPARQVAGWTAAQEAVRRGDPIAPALSEMGIFPDFVVEMIAVGERTGSLDTALHRAAETMERELECRLMAKG